jgi:hypothetical protein
MRTDQATGRRWTGKRARWAGTAAAASAAAMAVVTATGGGVSNAAANLPARATFDYTGEFANVASAPEGTPPIQGKSAMVVTTRATTTSVFLAGLDPNATYIGDVHDKACFNGEGGERFLFDPAGAKTPPNAIWLYPIKIDDKGRGTATVTSPAPAGPRAKSIVLHLLKAPGDKKEKSNPPRLACADLVRVTS